MQKVPLRIKELSVLKMPGFPRGIAAYRDLSPNINIIAGPNGSGKSSTARIIRDMIWKGRIRGVEAEGSVVTGEKSWDIKIDSGMKLVQSDGVDDQITGIPSSDASGRYMLAMHDLIVADESLLAKQILKESVGGYDLDEARVKLGYTEIIRNKGASEFREFKDAEKAVRLTEKKQQELKQEEDRLQELYKEIEKADAATEKLDFYRKVSDFAEARTEYKNLSHHFSKYPVELEKFNGDENKNILSLEQEINDLRSDIDKAEIIAGRNREKIAAVGIPGDGIDPLVIEELGSRVRELEELEREMAETEKRIAEFSVKARESASRICHQPDTRGWEGLSLEGVSKLDQFLQKYHQVLSEKQFYEARCSSLVKRLEEKPPSDKETLKEGIKILGNWLREAKSVTGINKIWLAAVAMAGLISGLLVYFFGLWGLFPVVLTGAFAFAQKSASFNDHRRRDFEKTGLRQPNAWETESVANILEFLISDLVKAESVNETEREIDIFRNQLTEAQQKLESIKKQGDEILAKIKAVPDIPEEDLRSYDGLYWFILHVVDWQKNNTEVAALTEIKQDINRRFNKNLGKFNDLSAGYNAAPVNDAAQTAAVLTRLKKAASGWKECMDEIDKQNDKIKERNKQIERSAAKLEEVYSMIGIESGQKEKVLELSGRLNEYKNVRQDLYAAGVAMSARRKVVESHPLYKDYGQEIDTLVPDRLHNLINALEQESGRREAVQKNITEIETNVNNVKLRHDLEESLSRKGKALDDLESLYELNLYSVTGQLLVDHLRAETRDKNRPGVLKAANELFNRITGGRYELILDDRGDPAFRAYDTVLKIGQELDELSSGTRLQLLMSVRIAFIGTVEPVLRLPILADELLANSDDTRARSIIEALVEISREGRQVFYFTAQGDEVLRWKNFLRSRDDVSLKIIELSGGDGERSVFQDPAFLPESFELKPVIPPPEDMSHDKYGEVLPVPPYEMIEENPERIHLWYLMDDNGLLYDCLSHGIKYWGQLQSYLAFGKIEGIDGKILAELEDKVRLVSRFRELYSKGRSRRVDREVLIDSGAVTESHIDKVAEKLAELNYDPKMLLSGLRKGVVPRFMRSKIDELEEFFLAGGYIDEHDTLETEEIVLMLRAYISNMNISVSGAEVLLNRIINKNREKLSGRR